VAGVLEPLLAVYIADIDGRIRYHHFGEGAYDECERVPG
jgi:hypothetical protein